MSKVTVCVRFRPFNSRESAEQGESSSIQKIDQESFIFKDEKDGEILFTFDRVFYEGSTQADVFDFIAMPAVRDAVNGINGTIITYGQTGAGKTFSMEGPGILACAEEQKGLLTRVIEGLFQFIGSTGGELKCIVKLSMVEIYMEKVRDLFDLSKGSIQVKESKSRGIFLSGVSEVCVSDSEEALKHLCGGIANRVVGETQRIWPVAGATVYMSSLFSRDIPKIQGKVNHVPYRDSKLTRILQDALNGNSRSALLCCCSPSPLDAPESLSTLRFGARTKQIKLIPKVSYKKDRKEPEKVILNHEDDYQYKSECLNRIIKKAGLSQLRQCLKEEHANFLEELLVMEGITFDPSHSIEDLEPVYDETVGHTISALSDEVELLADRVEKLTTENDILKAAATSPLQFTMQSALHLLWTVIADGWETALLPIWWVSVHTGTVIRDGWTAAILPVWWVIWAAESIFRKVMSKRRF